MGGSDDDIDSLVRAVAVAPAVTPPMRRQTTPRTRLEQGDVLGGRFELQALAGRGGMGEVWKSLDRESGATVAVKRIGVDDASSIARFEREARVLAAIDHPTVVRHVGHGVGDGEPWIAMEWLDGRDLASHLLVERMSMTDTCRVGARIAEALACVHGLGIIHRDVKPSNIFLVGGDPATAKLLDLGIARSTVEATSLTATHAVVGSVGYIAPEQARAVDDLDVRADLFSLGCVLYECVTGAPAFAGKQAVAALLKVMWDEVPRLSSVRAGVPRALDDLVAAMMEKDRARRPSSARAVVQALATLDAAVATAPTEVGAPLQSERRVASVILARQVGDLHDVDGALAELASRFDASMVSLDGSYTLVSMESGGAATDRAYRSACLALALRDQLGASIALATGTGVSSGRMVLGPVVDRAVELLAAAGDHSVVVDDVTEGLLGDRFEIEQTATSHVLLRARTQLAVRTLLGKPTPTVGRERELAMLGSMWTTCMEDRVASAAVVVAGPGMGKSRIRYELEQRIRGQSPDVNVLLARADPFAAGSALRLSREIVRAGMGLHDVPDALLATTVHARVRELCGDDADRIAEIITEMIGVANDAPSPRLVAARQDPTVMRDEVRRAVVLWLKAEAQRAPILLMLEDLHWGDPGSVEHVDDLLRVRDLHVMVLALARPEVRGLFPALWQRAAPVTIELGPLAAKAAERLVTTVLGDRLQPTVLARLVERADGNAFFLEELIRFAADGRSDEPPETVRAMVQSRFDRLAPDLRRVARAASVFGERVSDMGVAAVLGRDARGALDALVEHEILDRSPGARRSGLVEYIFRHALIQDAVYAMLTEHDRVAAHRAAAMWMVSAGDTDALAIAEHFERGGTPADAIPWLLEAARGASASHDTARTIDLTKRAIAHGAAGEVRGHLLTLQGEAYCTLWLLPEAIAAAEEALTLLPVDSVEYTSAAATGFAASVFANAQMSARLQAAIPKLLEILPTLAPSERTGFQRFGIDSALWSSGLVDAAIDQSMRHRARSLAAIAESEAYRHWADICDWYPFMFSTHDFGALRRLATSILVTRDTHPSPLAHAISRLWNVTMIGEIGAFDEFWPARDEARAEFAATGALIGSSIAGYYIERATRYAGRPIDERAIADVEAATAPFNQALAKMLRAERRLDAGDLAGAMALAGGIEQSGFAQVMSHARVVLGRVALAQARPADALAHAETGIAIRMALPSLWAELQLVRIDALEALGERERRRVGIDEVRARLEILLENTTAADRAHVLALPPFARIAALS